jgi:hypothetical protein
MTDSELNDLSVKIDVTAAELREDLANVKADVEVLMASGIAQLEDIPEADPEPVEPRRKSRVWRR